MLSFYVILAHHPRPLFSHLPPIAFLAEPSNLQMRFLYPGRIFRTFQRSNALLPTKHYSLTYPDPVGVSAHYCYKSFSCNTYESPPKCWALLTSWAQFSLQGVDKERLTVFSDGRRDDGRSRSPAFCSRGAASSHAGFAALPHAFQQTSVHPAAVAGGAVPDALRRLDLSRSRSAAKPAWLLAAPREQK